MKSFDETIDDILQETRDTISAKGIEYMIGLDPFHTFKEMGRLKNRTLQQGAWDAAIKQLVGVMDIIEYDRKEDLLLIKEKFGDLRVYLILIEASWRLEHDKGRNV